MGALLISLSVLVISRVSSTIFNDGPGTVDVEESDLDQVFIVVEEPPSLIGGLAGLGERITYPKLAQKAGIEGRVIVQFIVDKSGTVNDAVVLRGIGGGCDEEALRVVSETSFTAGRQRGQAVNVKMSLPIMFRLKG